MYEILASNYLERVYGPTRIEVLYQDEKHRIICTKPENSEQILELSSVTFLRPGVERFHNVHQIVVGGKSMGKAFQAVGVEFDRNVHGTYNYSLPQHFNRLFETGPHDMATIVDMQARVGPDSTPYANILETYSPQVAWFELGGMPDDELLGRIKEFNEALANIRG